jgi:hypothetical protein
MSFTQIIIAGISLKVMPGGFSPIWEGDEIVFTGTTNVQVLALPKRYGCEITAWDGDHVAYQALLAITNGQYRNYPDGLEVIDMLNPDSGESTTRRMFITDLKRTSNGTTVKLLSATREYLV